MQANAAFAKLWLAALDVSQTIARTIQTGGAKDSVVADMLGKIFDPRAWARALVAERTAQKPDSRLNRRLAQPISRHGVGGCLRSHAIAPKLFAECAERGQRLGETDIKAEGGSRLLAQSPISANVRSTPPATTGLDLLNWCSLSQGERRPESLLIGGVQARISGKGADRGV